MLNLQEKNGVNSWKIPEILSLQPLKEPVALVLLMNSYLILLTSSKKRELKSKLSCPTSPQNRFWDILELVA